MTAEKPTFDTQRTADVAHHFRSSTGVDCRVIDAEGRPVDRSIDASCPLCRELGALTGRPLRCGQAHLYGAFQSMRFGGRYTYFCPLGLAHVCSPILVDARMAGSFVGGPILLVEREELLDEISTVHDLGSGVRDALATVLESVPLVSPNRAHSIGEILLFSASWASGANVRELVVEEERLSRESRMSDYIHELKTMGGGATTLYPAETEMALLQTIREGDRTGAQEVLSQLLATIRVAAGEDVGTVKARVLELVVLLSRAAIDGGADAESVFGINYRAVEEINRFAEASELAEWLSRIVDRFVQFVFDVRSAGRNDTMIKALRAMRRRLGEKIGLEDIAGEVNLSSAYFSRVFKEETGTSFSARLAELRVERAKQLLKSTDRTILDIALDLGFADQSHFSRVFRARTGVSPGKYRSGAFPSESHEIHR